MILNRVLNNIERSPESIARAMKGTARETAALLQEQPEMAFGRHEQTILQLSAGVSHRIGDPAKTEATLDLNWKASFMFERDGHYGLMENGSPHTSILTANMRTILTPGITHQGINDLRHTVAMGIPDCIPDPAYM
jgi:hypothetical protein